MSKAPPIVDKIFRVGEKIVLLNGRQLETISLAGKKRATYGDALPWGFPRGTAANRWLIWSESTENNIAFDLLTKRKHPAIPVD